MTATSESGLIIFNPSIAVLNGPIERLGYFNPLLEDQLSDHAHPFGAAGRYWQLEAARLMSADWNEESFIERRRQELLEEGWEEDRITSALKYDHRRKSFVENGVQKAIDSISPKARASERFSTLEFDTPEGRKQYFCKFFYIPLPEENQFTMSPVLTESHTSREQAEDLDMFNFLHDQHSRLNIVGDFAQWNESWRRFWDANNVSQTDWKSAHNEFWRSLWYGQSPEERTLELFNGIHAHLQRLIVDHYTTWVALHSNQSDTTT